MRIYAFVNQKGGVGKTTTVINLGAFLAGAGYKTVLVDLDPQANATSSLGVIPGDVKRGIYELMIGSEDAENCLLYNPRLKLSLIPSSPALAGARVELVNLPDRETVLRQATLPLESRFDFMLIDCPPSLGLLTLNGLLCATHGVIIPIQCEYLALEGLTQLMETLKRVRSHLYPGLEIRGMLLTMHDNRTRLSKEVAAEVRQHFGDQVYQTIIPRSVRLAEAPSHGLPISAYDPNSIGGRAYLMLAREFIEGEKLKPPSTTEKEEA
jgi:chromosome partitioning protein